MASSYGRDRKWTCPGCGMPYDYDARDRPHGFTIGVTFASARRDIIAIQFDRKMGKKKYGRRNGTLGFMHELKKLAWRTHVDQCVESFDAAVNAGADPDSLLASNLAWLRKQNPPKKRTWKRKRKPPIVPWVRAAMNRKRAKRRKARR